MSSASRMRFAPTLPPQLVVDRDTRHRRDHDQDAEEPSAQPEDDRIEPPQRRARLAAETSSPVHTASHEQQRQQGQGGEAHHRAGDALGERRVRHLGGEVDVLRLVERVVDPAAVEEGVDQPAAGCGLKLAECPNPGSTT
jgi:hypothetical protein